MPKQQKTAMSMRTSDATEGGGIAGALATITEIENVQEFEYPGGKGNGAQAALRVVYDIEGQDRPWEQHYTYGKSSRYTVLDDGNSIEGPGLNKNSNAFRWFENAEEAAEKAGIDLSDLHGDGDISGYKDRQVKLKNTPYETVGGDKKTLIVIDTFETDEAPKTHKGNGKTATAKGKVDLTELAQAAAVAVITEEEKVKKSDLPGLVFQANKKDPNAKAIMQLCFKESFLTSGPWNYDAKRGILTPEDE